MVIRQLLSAICRIGLLSAVVLTVLPTGDAKAEPVILVLNLKIDLHNDSPLSQPTVMNNVFVRFDNSVTRTRTCTPAVSKWTYFDEMQEIPSVPVTPHTAALVAIDPGWPYEMGNDAAGRQYYKTSQTPPPLNLRSYSVGRSAIASYTDTPTPTSERLSTRRMEILIPFNVQLFQVKAAST